MRRPDQGRRRSLAGRGASTGLGSAHALALGLVQGPAELLPISSSAHMALVPWLADWPERALDPELRNGLAVAAHAGTALALLLTHGRLLPAAARSVGPRRVALVLAATGLPAATGWALERPIEQRLATPAAIAGGLLAGSLAMAIADLRPGRRRSLKQAGALDGVLLGVAQSAALLPGVSRNGATLAVARARGFDRRDAARLSQQVGVPVMAGAGALKGLRLVRRPLAQGSWTALAGATAGAFASTIACARLLGDGAAGRALGPFVLYRCALALLVIRRLRDNGAVAPNGLVSHE